MNTVENINKVKIIRGYGEGSVYQRKDGRWVGKYKDEKMLKPRYVYGKTEAEARRKLREFKKTIVHGITDCRKVLLSTYIERWLYTFKAAAVENTSFDRLESVYYTHIKPTLGGFQLGNIKAVDIQTLLNQKSTEYSYTIVKMIRQILSEVFQHAYTEGDILKNPMANVIMAKRSKFKPERKMLILEDAEVKRLEEAAREKYGTGRPLFVHGNLIVFMLHTGLRCGELLALEWSDIDLDNAVVHITKTLNLKQKINSPKSKSSYRDIDIDPRTVTMLKQYKHRQTKEAWKLGRTEKVVFSDFIHEYPFSRTLRSKLADHFKRAKVPNIGFHGFRHTHASLLLNAGIPYKELQHRLGHSTLSMTMDTYSHLSKESAKKAVSIFETALNNIKSS